MDLSSSRAVADLPQLSKTLEELNLFNCGDLPLKAIASLASYPNLKKVILNNTSNTTLPQLSQRDQELIIGDIGGGNPLLLKTALNAA